MMCFVFFWLYFLYGQVIIMRANPFVKAVIYEALYLSGVENDVGLRITRREGKLFMKLDKAKESDTVIKLNQSILVIVDSYLAAELGDAVIDINPIEADDDLVLRHVQHKFC